METETKNLVSPAPAPAVAKPMTREYFFPAHGKTIIAESKEEAEKILKNNKI